jgi:hypothetical protein
VKELETPKDELEKALASTAELPPLLHPNMAEIYRQRISTLYGLLSQASVVAGRRNHRYRHSLMVAV